MKSTAGTLEIRYFANHLVAGSTEEAITTEVRIIKTTSWRKKRLANKVTMSIVLKIVPALMVIVIGRSVSFIYNKSNRLRESSQRA